MCNTMLRAVPKDAKVINNKKVLVDYDKRPKYISSNDKYYGTSNLINVIIRLIKIQLNKLKSMK